MGKFRERKIRLWWFRVIFVAGLVAGIVFLVLLESSRAQTIGVNPVPPPSSTLRQTLPGIPPPPPDPVGAKYYALGPMAFNTDNSFGKITPFQCDFYRLNLQSANTNDKLDARSWGFFAPVHLPGGAVIWGWRAWVVDNLPTGQISRLGVYIVKPGEIYSWIVGTPQETSIPSAENTVKMLYQANQSRVVNNRDYYYSFYFQVRGVNVEFRGAVIVYTMPAGGL